MTCSKGGYRPDSRLETVRDEIVCELVEGLRGPAEYQAEAFREVVRLGRKYLGLLAHINGAQPPLALAGA